jgi:hypothetical protein
MHLLGIVIACGFAIASMRAGQPLHRAAAPVVKVALPVEQQITRYLEATTTAVNSTNLVARVRAFCRAFTTATAIS